MSDRRGKFHALGKITGKSGDTDTRADVEIAQIEIDGSTRLEKLETIIQDNLLGFYRVGMALQAIRDEKLYLKSHDNFESYCRERWDMSRVSAHRQIAAMEVYQKIDLLPIGNKPSNESQVRPLTVLSDDDQVSAWQEAVKTAPNGRITAAFVARVAAKYNPAKKKLKSASEQPKGEKTDEKFSAVLQQFLDAVSMEAKSNWRNVSRQNVRRALLTALEAVEEL